MIRLLYIWIRLLDKSIFLQTKYLIKIRRLTYLLLNNKKSTIISNKIKTLYIYYIYLLIYLNKEVLRLKG